ncbi:MAG: bifunctional phosphoribosylaminoimidazolecarboxamide formyltransferase/IMP cyclohydrolase [Bacteroidales bacterium]|nr:bifunctional phosphoribosylaminoimidazolecarboxamide formyltransferase/IMP cyclohydrolase [Bacteroidales bacterium]
MLEERTIKRIFLSWFDKKALLSVLPELRQFEGEIIASDGTAQFLREHGILCTSVSEWTGYPAMLDGRVKTLHPLVFGSILARNDFLPDSQDIVDHNLKPFDLVCVQLYPFAEYLKLGKDEDALIEKIDIGGVSLIRAAAKNYKYVVVISSEDQLPVLRDILRKKVTTYEERRKLAYESFFNTFKYDACIANWLGRFECENFVVLGNPMRLRYGENPDQEGYFYGDLTRYFDILQGKELSYNNLLDISSALSLLQEFEEPVSVVVKHGNPCGVASRKSHEKSLQRAIASDPISAFGGIIATNDQVERQDAEFLSQMFYEVLLAPSFTPDALEVLSAKQSRILIKIKSFPEIDRVLRQINLGYLLQTKQKINFEEWEYVSGYELEDQQLADAKFGVKVVQHLLSNAIVIVKDQQLIGAGMGQPNRVDAVRHAIEKAKRFGFDLNGGILVSDGFFPFTDSLELAYQEGIKAVIEPGGSIRDKEIIQFCKEKTISLIFTHQRYFKH